MGCGRNTEVKAQLEAHPWADYNPDKPPPLILGFVSNVHEYMAAADILVTKAGPGTIAEAMILGLPCLLTSFIPGQEEGNISFVRDGQAGDYVSDEEPQEIADTICTWLREPEMLATMSRHAQALGRPQSTLEIASRICDGFLNLDEVILLAAEVLLYG